MREGLSYRHSRRSTAGTVSMLLVLLLAVCGNGYGAGWEGTAGDQRIIERIRALGTPFVANEGQLSEEVRFRAMVRGSTLFITTGGDLVYSFPSPDGVPGPAGEGGKAEGPRGGWVLKERLAGSFPHDPRGAGISSTRISCFKGDRREDWRPRISAFEEVDFGEVYHGVRFRLRVRGDNVEKVFVVDPGGDPEAIRIALEGCDSILVRGGGELEVSRGPRRVAFTVPAAYQEGGGEREPVQVAYMVKGREYGFRVGPYDRERPLVIDPLLATTFVGGSGYDTLQSLAIDAAGNIYVVGRTLSADFPVTLGAYDEVQNGSEDVFVLKLSPNLGFLLASSYLGGTGNDSAYACALDAGGNLYVVGCTDSNPFPTTLGPGNSGVTDVFVAKFNQDLDTLVACRLIGGTNADLGRGVGLSSTGETVFVTGYTASADFENGTEGYDQVHKGGIDAFVSAFTSDLAQYRASTFIGGAGDDYIFCKTVITDSVGDLFLVGTTGSDPFPTAGTPYDATHNGGTDAFILNLSSGVTDLLASTLLGGSGDEQARRIRLDSAGNVYVTGYTGSADFPATTGAYDESHNGGLDVFVSILTPGLSSLTASTFLGGTGNDLGYNIQLDTYGNVFVGGTTYSGDFPTKADSDEYDKTLGGVADIFVAKLGGNLETLIFSAFYGGSGEEVGSWGLGTDNWLASGGTDSSDLPVTSGAYDTTHNGIFDAFLSLSSPPIKTIRVFSGRAGNLEE